jgi:hypothetical protein
MYMLINALIIALLIPAGSPESVRRAEAGPSCRAVLEGTNLMTTMEFPTGLTVEGPWRVLHTTEAGGDDANVTIYATLDRVIETDELTGGNEVIPFPEPISLSFEGADRSELMQRAAQVWCVTVMRAQQNQRLENLSPNRAFQTRVARLGGSGTAAAG